MKTSQYIFRIVAFVVIALMIYWFNRINRTKYNPSKKDQKLFQQKRRADKQLFLSKMDRVLFSKGYIKTERQYQPSRYDILIKRGEAGHIIRYTHPEFDKSLELVYNQRFSKVGLLCKIFVFRHHQVGDGVVYNENFIDFEWIQKDLDLYIDNSRSIIHITAKQLLKVLSKANNILDRDNWYPVTSSNPLRQGSRTLKWIYGKFEFLISNENFNINYCNENYPNYWNIGTSVVAYMKEEIEIIIYYSQNQDGMSIIIFLLKKNKETKEYSLHYQHNDRKINELISEMRQHI